MRVSAGKQYGPEGVFRRYYLPFDSEVDIAALGTVTVVAEPQECFLGDELVIDSLRAPDFTVDEIIVGRTPQAIAAGVSAASVWSEVAVRSTLVFDPAGPGTNISIRMTNTFGAGATRAMATLFGVSANN
jgi:hypothetical protein